MNKEIYRRAKEFKRKYPMTIAFRLRAHAKVASKFIGSDEEIKYVFVAQKNYQSYEIIDTVKEEVILSNIDRNALAEIDDNITMTMIEEKKEYGRDLETKKKDK